MKNSTRILSICLLTNSLFLFSQTAKINPSVDTYIESNSPTSSFSTAASLKIKHTFSKSTERTAWIKFPTTNFPTNKTQVLLKLVKIAGDEGNVSLFGANGNLAATATWNSPPATISNFYYGGIRKGDVYYFDVTEYVTQQASSSSGFVAFKIFTNSIINSTIEFASNEATNTANRPELLFYATKQYDIPLFSMHGTVTIPTTEGGNLTGEVLGKKNTIAETRDTYGGLQNAKSTATGYFRVEKDCDNVWHIIDPDGNLFYSAGLNTVETGGGRNMPQELKNLGLNTMGSWSDETIKNFAYTPRFNVLSGFKNSDSGIKATYNKDVMPVFETGFKAFCVSLAQTQLQPYLTDKWVLGYFLDNELVFHKNQLSISLTLATSNAQYKEADKWMKAKYGTGYSKTISAADEATYQGYVVETYFKTVTEAFRAVDPNHMIIGTRFHAGVKYIPEIFVAAGKYTDIISVNYYSRFEPEEDVMDMWLSSGQKPFITTEFYVKGDDLGLANTDGAGWTVPTQQDRANWYENWMLKLLKNKGNVGFHWFRYMDKVDDGSNKGLYSATYSQYQTLANSISKTCNSIYSLRSQILYGNTNYNDLLDCDYKLCGTNKSCQTLSTENNSSIEILESKVYPNPASQSIAISNTNGGNYEMYSLTGQKVLSGSITSDKHEVTIQHLNAGIYIVKVADYQEKIAVFKIIKQ